MSNFLVNPDNAELLDEDDTFYNLFHPNLGKFQVAKAALEAETHGFIKNLKPQKMADGAIVEPIATPAVPQEPASLEKIIPDSGIPASPVMTHQWESIPEGAPLNEIQKEYNNQLRTKRLGLSTDDFGVPIDTSGVVAPDFVPGAEQKDLDLDALKQAELVIEARNKTAADAVTALEQAQQAKQAGLAKLGVPTETAPTAPEAPKPPAPQQEPALNQPQDTGVVPKQNVPAAPPRQAAAIDPEIERLKNIDATVRELEVQDLEYLKKTQADFLTGRKNPNEVFTYQGTGNKILSALSIVLGGISQGILKTGSNPALDVINKAVERQLEQDKIAFEREDRALGRFMESKRDVYDRLHKKRMEYFEAIKLQAAQHRQKFEDAKSMLEFEKLNTDIVAGQIKNSKDFNVLKATEMVDSGAAGKPGIFTPQQVQAITEADKEQAGRFVTLPDGTMAKSILDTAATQKSNDALALIYDAKQARERVLGLMQEGGFNTDISFGPGTEAKARAKEGKVAMETLKAKLREVQRVTGEQKIKGLEAALPADTEAFDVKSARAALGGVEDLLNDSEASELRKVTPHIKIKTKPKSFTKGLSGQK